MTRPFTIHPSITAGGTATPAGADPAAAAAIAAADPGATVAPPPAAASGLPDPDAPLRTASDVYAWLAASEDLVPISAWMGGPECELLALLVQEAARTSVPLRIRALESLRALAALEGADGPDLGGHLWLQTIDPGDERIDAACQLYERLAEACAVAWCVAIRETGSPADPGAWLRPAAT